MKLIVCLGCNDVVSLRNQERSCYCGKSGGHYTDNLNVIIWGEAIPLGFDNLSFIRAMQARPDSGQGITFTAFIIPVECPTVQQI